jgi:polyisoprenoid-binding protein YceI
VKNPSKIPLLAKILFVFCLAAGLVGCPTPPRAPPPTTERPASESPPGTNTSAPSILPQPLHLGRPYDVAATESLLTIRVYRGGPLAKAGHNHVIASHALRGSLYVPVDLAQSTFEIHMPVTELTVDEPSLRADEHSDDFPSDVPDSAKEGTRHNMLSPALLDGDQYPEIVLRSERVERVSGPIIGASGSSDAGRNDSANGPDARWLAHIQVTVRDKTNTVVLPVSFVQHADVIEVSGEFPLKQTDLGLTPFSALLRALQVVDEMKIRFHVVAHAAVTQTGN